MKQLTSPRIGTVGFDGSPGRTFSKLGCLEYQESFRGSPSHKVLGRVGRKAGDDFGFVLRASCAITHAGDPLTRGITLGYLPDSQLPAAPFDSGELTQLAWQWTLAAARQLGAEAIYLETPDSFRPTDRNHRRLADFIGSVDAGELTLIWQGQGLWSAEDQIAVCDELGLLPCLDPLLEEAPTTAAYLRVMGRARRAGGLTADELYRVAEFARALGDPRVTLNTAAPYRDALTLLRVLND